MDLLSFDALWVELSQVAPLSDRPRPDLHLHDVGVDSLGLLILLIALEERGVSTVWDIELSVDSSCEQVYSLYLESCVAAGTSSAGGY